jgi:hypothetical protein
MSIASLRRELVDLRKQAATRSTAQRMQDVSAMDLLIVSRLRAIKYQEAKDAGLQGN